MSSPVRALSPGSSLSSFDLFSPSRRNSESTAHTHSGHGARSHSSSSESDDSLGTASSSEEEEDDESDESASSDDEVLLSFSDLSSADFLSQRGDPRTPAVFSDTESEFVIMSRPRSPASDGGDLVASFSTLSMASAHSSSSRRRAASGSNNSNSSAKAKMKGQTKGPVQAAGSSGSPRRRNRKRRAAQTPGASSAVAGEKENAEKHQSPSKARRKVRRAAARAAAPSPSPTVVLAPVTTMEMVLGGLGDRPIVDDVSEAGGDLSCIPPELYKRAQTYVSSVLADPAIKAEVPKLEFLQALIIELGLYTSLPSLPNSMRAAKALLKSQVFLNVRDYLAVRSQGVEALRNVMHPSRSALMREIRSGKRAPVKSVKDSGLGVLLVTCYR